MHMLTKLLMVLHSKVALVAIGLTLVVGTGTVAVSAATGKSLPLLAQVASTATRGQHDPNEADGPNHDGQHCQSGQQGNAENDEQANEQANEQGDLDGTIGTVDAAHSSFTLMSEDKQTHTVVVSSGTAFHGSLHGLSDLKAGMQVEVEGTPLKDGAIAAARVDAGDQPCGNQAGDNRDGNSQSADGK
jgi:uncharacterized protein DUF5666